jgi:hypothetical protein
MRVYRSAYYRMAVSRSIPPRRVVRTHRDAPLHHHQRGLDTPAGAKLTESHKPSQTTAKAEGMPPKKEMSVLNTERRWQHGDEVKQVGVYFISTSVEFIRDPHEVLDNGGHLFQREPKGTFIRHGATPGNLCSYWWDRSAARASTSSGRKARTPAPTSTEAIRPSLTARMNSLGPRPDARSASAGESTPPGTTSRRVTARRRARTTLGCPMSPISSLISRDDIPPRWASTIAESRISRAT